MKNVFFALAFMLVGTFAFANNLDETRLNVDETIEIINSKIYSEFNTVNAIKIEVVDDFKQCHVTIKGTINGQEVDLDIAFTSDSGSCIKDTIKLLKELAA